MNNQSPDAKIIYPDHIIIRQLKETDLPSLEWEGEYIHFRRVYANAFKRACKGLSVLWVAELHEWGIIGQVFVQLKCDRPELANGINRAYFYAFRVRPHFRNMGVGTKLLDTLEDDLRHRKFKWVTLNVARINISAQRFYSRHGYATVANEAGIWTYPDHNGEWQSVVEPAWRMEKALVSSYNPNR